MERSEYYNEDKKTADAVCRAVKPKSAKSKKGTEKGTENGTD